MADKWTHDELWTALKTVTNPSDWKDEIKATIREDQKEIVTEAIIHFTATVPWFKVLPKGKLLVRAEGYRMGPAGDH